MKIYCDSSTREACIVIEGQDPIVLPYPEPVTTNQGEYNAVILALIEALNRNFESVMILTDSLLVVKQVNGDWRCRKPHLLPLRDRVRGLLGTARGTIGWIKREDNLAGRVLAGR